MASFTFTGTAEMKARLQQLLAASVDKMKQGLRVEAETVMTDSKDNYVPIDLGALKSSGHVKPVERSGKSLEVTLAYGGAAAPYAVVQHENPDFFHPNGKSWKYLEKPLNAAIPGMLDRIAGDILEGA